MKDEPPTKVIFRKWHGTNEVIALFPQIAADMTGIYCSSYEHVGQHGAADYTGVVGRTTPATPEEYADLKRELEGRGYTLSVATKSGHADAAIRYMEFDKQHTTKKA